MATTTDPPRDDHWHVRVVRASCPEGHIIAVLAGTATEPDNDTLVAQFVAMLTERRAIQDTCQTCGAQQATWEVDVLLSPPIATEEEANALATRVAHEAMGETPCVAADVTLPTVTVH